jgi:hypothetical protein
VHKRQAQPDGSNKDTAKTVASSSDRKKHDLADKKSRISEGFYALRGLCGMLK